MSWLFTTNLDLKVVCMFDVIWMVWVGNPD